MKILIIGCGNMGTGLAMRLSTTNQLYLFDHHIEKAVKLEQQGFGKAYFDLKKALKSAEIVILAIKPQNLDEVRNLIKKELKNEQLVVSLIAGTSLQELKQFFPKTPIVRMMPNLPLLYGEGVIGLASDQQNEALTEIFKPLGKIYWFTEDKIKALTALTGSGPAFFFVMVEAMIDAGIAMGFSAEQAQQLIYQMLQGSLTLLKNSEKHPGELKWQITTPQGTTIKGIQTLEDLAVRSGIMNTFLAAYQK